jgi:hypothetical protein
MAITGTDILAGIRCGDAVTCENMTVAPLIRSEEECEGLEYLVLREAFDADVLRVTETSESGTVPELAVRNTGKFPVLILDGEELAGAKQNRVVNTSVLVPPETKIVVPVSCTEAGRWNYRSASFADSDLIMSSTIRAKKSRSVSENLNSSSSFRSNQGEVWSEIEREADACGVRSATGAMKDTYETHRERMKEQADKFSLVEGQAGCLVFLNGRPAGLELLSRPEKYALLHEKVLRSYAVSTLRSLQKAVLRVTQTDVERRFSEILPVHAACFPSVGMGDDCRLREATMVGSALRHEEETIHAAVFWLDADTRNGQKNGEGYSGGRMSSYRERRGRTFFDSGTPEPEY